MFEKKSGLFTLNPKVSANAEINGEKYERITEKAGEFIGGETGKKIGGVIDDLTDWLTIKIDL